MSFRSPVFGLDPSTSLDVCLHISLIYAVELLKHHCCLSPWSCKFITFFFPLLQFCFKFIGKEKKNNSLVEYLMLYKPKGSVFSHFCCIFMLLFAFFRCYLQFSISGSDFSPWGRTHVCFVFHLWLFSSLFQVVSFVCYRILSHYLVWTFSFR